MGLPATINFGVRAGERVGTFRDLALGNRAGAGQMQHAAESLRRTRQRLDYGPTSGMKTNSCGESIGPIICARVPRAAP